MLEADPSRPLPYSPGMSEKNSNGDLPAEKSGRQRGHRAKRFSRRSSPGYFNGAAGGSVISYEFKAPGDRRNTYAIPNIRAGFWLISGKLLVESLFILD